MRGLVAAGSMFMRPGSALSMVDLQPRPVVVEPGDAGLHPVVDEADDRVLLPVEAQAAGQIRLRMRREDVAGLALRRCRSGTAPACRAPVRGDDQAAVAVEATGATCGSARPNSPSATQAASAWAATRRWPRPLLSSVTAARATPLRSATQPTTSPGISPLFSVSSPSACPSGRCPDSAPSGRWRSPSRRRCRRAARDMQRGVARGHLAARCSTAHGRRQHPRVAAVAVDGEQPAAALLAQTRLQVHRREDQAAVVDPLEGRDVVSVDAGDHLAGLGVEVEHGEMNAPFHRDEAAKVAPGRRQLERPVVRMPEERLDRDCRRRVPRSAGPPGRGRRGSRRRARPRTRATGRFAGTTAAGARNMAILAGTPMTRSLVEPAARAELNATGRRSDGKNGDAGAGLERGATGRKLEPRRAAMPRDIHATPHDRRPPPPRPASGPGTPPCSVTAMASTPATTPMC